MQRNVIIVLIVLVVAIIVAVIGTALGVGYYYYKQRNSNGGGGSDPGPGPSPHHEDTGIMEWKEERDASKSKERGKCLLYQFTVTEPHLGLKTLDAMQGHDKGDRTCIDSNQVVAARMKKTCVYKVRGELQNINHCLKTDGTYAKAGEVEYSYSSDACKRETKPNCKGIVIRMKLGGSYITPPTPNKHNPVASVYPNNNKVLDNLLHVSMRDSSNKESHEGVYWRVAHQGSGHVMSAKRPPKNAGFVWRVVTHNAFFDDPNKTATMRLVHLEDRIDKFLEFPVKDDEFMQYASKHHFKMLCLNKNGKQGDVVKLNSKPNDKALVSIEIVGLPQEKEIPTSVF